jgi:cathepsin L
MDIFFKNLDDIYEHNSIKNNTFKIGINQLSDLTYEEIYFFNAFGENEEELDVSKIVQTIDGIYLKVNDSVSIPDSFDWRDRNAVSRVRDQQLCGSCFAFAALHAIESQFLIHQNKSVELSTQEIVDCGSGYGMRNCEGGASEGVFYYINAMGGVSLEKDYPYSAELGNCKENLNRQKIKIKSVAFVDSNDDNDVEEELKKAIFVYGPMVVAFDHLHNSFFRYESGVYFEPNCDPGHETSHVALIVGYGTDENGVDFWTLKNSWAATWGEEGYIRMARNKNKHCRIGDHVCMPVLDL